MAEGEAGDKNLVPRVLEDLLQTPSVNPVQEGLLEDLLKIYTELLRARNGQLKDFNTLLADLKQQQENLKLRKTTVTAADIIAVGLMVNDSTKCIGQILFAISAIGSGAIEANEYSSNEQRLKDLMKDVNSAKPLEDTLERLYKIFGTSVRKLMDKYSLEERVAINLVLKISFRGILPEQVLKEGNDTPAKDFDKKPFYKHIPTKMLDFLGVIAGEHPVPLATFRGLSMMTVSTITKVVPVTVNIACNTSVVAVPLTAHLRMPWEKFPIWAGVGAALHTLDFIHCLNSENPHLGVVWKIIHKVEGDIKTMEIQERELQRMVERCRRHVLEARAERPPMQSE